MKLKDASFGKGGFPKGLSHWKEKDWENWLMQASTDERVNALHHHTITKLDVLLCNFKVLELAIYGRAIRSLRKGALLGQEDKI